MKYPKIDSHAHVYIGTENAPDRVLYYADRLGINKLMKKRGACKSRKYKKDVRNIVIRSEQAIVE